MQRRKRDVRPDRLRRARRHFQSNQRRRARLRRDRRRHRHGHAHAALRSLPSDHLGILRRRSRRALELKRENRSPPDARFVSETVRHFESLTCRYSSLAASPLYVINFRNKFFPSVSVNTRFLISSVISSFNTTRGSSFIPVRSAAPAGSCCSSEPLSATAAAGPA